MSRERSPGSLGDALASYLAASGLKPGIERAGVVEGWPVIVGPEVARVTEPLGVTEDGILFVRVATGPWAQELRLMSPEILRLLQAAGGGVRRIVWQTG